MHSLAFNNINEKFAIVPRIGRNVYVYETVTMCNAVNHMFQTTYFENLELSSCKYLKVYSC